MSATNETTYRVPPELAQQTLASALRHWVPGQTWSQIRRLVSSRRVIVSGNLCLDPARRVKADEVIKLLARAAAEPPREESVRIRHLDAHLLVIEKPAGMTSIRHPEERDWPARRKQLQPTLDELLPRLVAAQRKHRGPPGSPAKHRGLTPPGSPPRVRPVHRLDRETSGLMVFARTVEAERGLGMQFRKHTVHRRYLAIVHGQLKLPLTYESQLVRDRGDGRRGSTTLPKIGKRAVTHVAPLEPLGKYTFVECRLETGRTHQIRIHLAEAGHMLCGEKVYHSGRLAPRGERHAERGDHNKPPAPRVMLHAAELGFEHPVTGEPLLFQMEPPEDFAKFLAGLRQGQ